MATSRKQRFIKPVKPKKLIYIGPTLSEGRLSFSTVFMDGFPVYVQGIIDKNPWFKALFVPIPEMETAVASTKQKGSFLNIMYNKAKEV